MNSVPRLIQSTSDLCREKTKVLKWGKWIKEKKEYLKDNKI